MKKRITNTENDPHVEWLVGENPSAIEEQEKAGQNELILSTQLPRTVNYPRGSNAAEHYHKMGIKVFTSSKNDDLFLGVKLPDGWTLQSTDHAMWSNLVDDKCRIRATIFYKASFHDREAFINFNRRINYRVNRIGFLNEDYTRDDTGEYASDKTPIAGRVTDFDGKVIFETNHIELSVEFNNGDNG